MVGQYLPQTNEKCYSVRCDFSPTFPGSKHSHICWIMHACEALPCQGRMLLVLSALLLPTPSVQWRCHVSKLNHPIPAAHTLGHSGKPLHLNVKCGHGSYELMSTAELTHHDRFFSLQNATDFSANKNCKSQAPVGVSTVKRSRN